MKLTPTQAAVLRAMATGSTLKMNSDGWWLSRHDPAIGRPFFQRTVQYRTFNALRDLGLVEIAAAGIGSATYQLTPKAMGLE